MAPRSPRHTQKTFKVELLGLERVGAMFFVRTLVPTRLQFVVRDLNTKKD